MPSPITLLAEPLPEDMDSKEKAQLTKRAKEVLGNAKMYLCLPNLDENMTFEEFLEEIDTTYEEYMKCIRISDKGKVLVLKRKIKERLINNYNQEMLVCWNANMDLQIALDPYAVISYIANYMMKDENSTTPFLKEALNSTAKLDVRERLKALKTAYLTHRQVGASEAVYKSISGMRLKDSNVDLYLRGNWIS